jgi:diacylglycerol O-acyltransferase / wax synthase
MDHPTSPMVIVGFFELDRPVDLAALREVAAERLLRHRRFRQTVDERPGRRPRWVDAHVDLNHHVREVEADGSDLAVHADRLSSTPIDRSRPLWEILVVTGDHPSILVRLHHSIADGMALLAVLMSVCDAADGDEATLPSPRDLGGSYLRRILGLLSGVVRLTLLRADPSTSLRVPLSGTKRTAWSPTISVESLKQAGRTTGATINDLLVAGVSGAVRELLSVRGERPDRDIRAMVPFNLRPPTDGTSLGNRFGMVLPQLPITIEGVADRLVAATAAMDRIKRTFQAEAAFAIVQVMGTSAAIVEAAIVRFFGPKSSLVLTNVAGPTSRLRLAGVDVTRLMFWVPQAGGIGLGVSLMSYDGGVTLGVTSDAAVLAEPGHLVDAWVREMGLLMGPA